MATKEEIIKEFQAERGRLGGEAVLKKYGKKHFRNLIKKRWANVDKGKKPLS